MIAFLGFWVTSCYIHLDPCGAPPQTVSPQAGQGAGAAGMVSGELVPCEYIAVTRSEAVNEIPALLDEHLDLNEAIFWNWKNILYIYRTFR